MLVPRRRGNTQGKEDAWRQRQVSARTRLKNHVIPRFLGCYCPLQVQADGESPGDSSVQTKKKLPSQSPAQSDMFTTWRPRVRRRWRDAAWGMLSTTTPVRLLNPCRCKTRKRMGAQNHRQWGFRHWLQAAPNCHRPEAIRPKYPVAANITQGRCCVGKLLGPDRIDWLSRLAMTNETGTLHVGPKILVPPRAVQNENVSWTRGPERFRRDKTQVKGSAASGRDRLFRCHSWRKDGYFGRGNRIRS